VDRDASSQKSKEGCFSLIVSQRGADGRQGAGIWRPGKLVEGQNFGVEKGRNRLYSNTDTHGTSEEALKKRKRNKKKRGGQTGQIERSQGSRALKRSGLVLDYDLQAKNKGRAKSKENSISSKRRNGKKAAEAILNVGGTKWGLKGHRLEDQSTLLVEKRQGRLKNEKTGVCGE